MIVGITGPSCAGKTTVVRELERHGFARVEEVARVVFREKYASRFTSLAELRRDSKAVFEYQVDVLRRQVEEEEAAAKRSEFVVTDRTVFDNYAYAKLHVPEPYFSAYLEVFDRYARSRKYDAVFLFHPVKAVSDGFRTTTDVKTQVKQMRLIREVLESYNVNYVEVSVMPVEERVRAILSALPTAPQRW